MNLRIHRAAIAAFLPLVLFALAGAAAQVARRVPRGEISGLDLQVEGQTRVYRGGRARLAFTAFEVLGLDRLRRAPRTAIDVHASFSRDAAVASVVTDAEGRAFAEFDVPSDVPPSVRLVVEARSPNRVQRRFEIPIDVVDGRELELSVRPSMAPPGSTFVAEGRAFDRASRRPLGGVPVELRVQGPRGPVGDPTRLVTDGDGHFAHSLTLPNDVAVGGYRLSLRVIDPRPVETVAAFVIGTQSTPPLLVSLAPERVLVRPRTDVPVTVLVRRPDGRPVPGALVTTLAPEAERVAVRTDGRGRAQVSFRSLPSSVGLSDQSLSVSVEKAGLGAVSASTTVRVIGTRYIGRMSFEGGRFAEALGGRVFVRVVGPDGRPAPEVAVRLVGPRLPEDGVEGQTDRYGVAAIDVTLLASTSERVESDACGGTVATQIEAVLGNSEGRASRCLAIDPDGVIRLRADVLDARAGVPFTVRVDRVPALGRVPVVVDAFTGESGLVGAALARVTIPANEREASITLPSDAGPLAVLYARPLLGPEAAESRGASAAVFVSGGQPIAISARFDRERGRIDVETRGGEGEPITVRAYAYPYEDAVGSFRRFDAANQAYGPALETADDRSEGDSYRRALLADRTPTDILAAHARIDGVVSPVPAPENPESLGRLRDPYRARARFIQGRLSLLFRAIEAFVDEHVPGSIQEVAHLERDRWVLNEAVLAAVAAGGGLGSEGATGLGGEPITISQLRTLDPSFGYDAVARRITRERLFNLLVGLRSYVNDNGFDLAWARPGDPRFWVQQMIENGTSAPVELDEDRMVDAWGRPFQLIPTARPRFTLLQPIVGFELVSAGPDGRYGNADDVFDPTARVLATDSLYARSVQEDSLVARLRGVELSRATLVALGTAFDVYSEEVYYNPEESTFAPSDPSAALPNILEPDPDPLAIRRAARLLAARDLGTSRAEGGHAALPVDLGVEPRSWAVHVVATTPSGQVARTYVRATTGSPVLLHGDIPARVHAGEPLTVDLGVTGLDDTERNVSLRVSSCDGAGIDVPANLRVPAGENTEFAFTIRGSRPERCPVRLDVLEGDRLLATTERIVDIASGRHPERRRVSALVDDDGASLDLAAPEDANRIRARVSVVDSASILELPDLAGTRVAMPAILAWARVATGRTLDDALRDDVLRSFEDGSRVPTKPEVAAAIIALASRPDDAEARILGQRLPGLLGTLPSMPGPDASSGALRGDAATVVALALAGVPSPDDPPVDAIAGTLRRLIPALRRVVRSEVTTGTDQAYAAAALLLADANDAHGRVLYDRALAASRARRGARMFTETAGRGPSEALGAAAAMALAGAAVGRHDEARAFAETALLSIPALARGTPDGLVLLGALSAYGTLAGDGAPEVEVRIDGTRTPVAFEDGIVTLPVSIDAGDRARIDVRVTRGRFVVAEAEVAYERPFVAEQRGPMALTIRGDVGDAYGVAALEIEIAATEAVVDPVLELELPPGVEADPAFLASLASTGIVRVAEARAGGFVRMQLMPMTATTARIPLALPFRARGRFTGLAASIYPATASYRRTVLPPREFDFAAPQ